MKKEAKRSLLIALCMLTAFVFWTVAVCFIDVKAIGPNDSNVGFATLNSAVHDITGVNKPKFGMERTSSIHANFYHETAIAKDIANVRKKRG